MEEKSICFRLEVGVCGNRVCQRKLFENGTAGTQPKNEKHKVSEDPKNLSEEQLGGYFC